jgi:hypothetical protein
MQVLNGQRHSEVLECFDSVEVFRADELKSSAKREMCPPEKPLAVRTFELTRCCVDGRSPMGVGLHDPAVTCLPLVSVLPLQKLIKLQGDCQTTLGDIKERNKTILVIRGGRVSLPGGLTLSIYVHDNALVERETAIAIVALTRSNDSRDESSTQSDRELHGTGNKTNWASSLE